MPVYLVDTSALCKRYFVNEIGAQVVQDLFGERNSERFILNLGIVETLNAFYRVCRQGQITPVERDVLVQSLYQDILDGTLQPYSVRDEHIRHAEPVIAAVQSMTVTNKRPGPFDAILVACALDFDPADRVLVSSDRDLNNLANQFSIVTLDPEQPLL